METIKKEGFNEVLEMALDYLSNNPDCYACDLHNEVYNTDYFIIGKYQAEQWLNKNYGVFPAIYKIKEYEESNFGEVNTDMSEPEKVCNMLVYIIGEEILNESETLREVWNNTLTSEDCEKISEELKELER